MGRHAHGVAARVIGLLVPEMLERTRLGLTRRVTAASFQSTVRACLTRLCLPGVLDAVARVSVMALHHLGGVLAHEVVMVGQMQVLSNELNHEGARYHERYGHPLTAMESSQAQSRDLRFRPNPI